MKKNSVKPQMKNDALPSPSMYEGAYKTSCLNCNGLGFLPYVETYIEKGRLYGRKSEVECGHCYGLGMTYTI